MEMAGIMSVPKSMARMSWVERGRGSWVAMNSRKGRISGMFELKV